MQTTVTQIQPTATGRVTTMTTTVEDTRGIVAGTRCRAYPPVALALTRATFLHGEEPGLSPDEGGCHGR